MYHFSCHEILGQLQKVAHRNTISLFWDFSFDRNCDFGAYFRKSFKQRYARAHCSHCVQQAADWPILLACHHTTGSFVPIFLLLLLPPTSPLIQLVFMWFCPLLGPALTAPISSSASNWFSLSSAKSVSSLRSAALQSWYRGCRRATARQWEGGSTLAPMCCWAAQIFSLILT